MVEIVINIMLKMVMNTIIIVIQFDHMNINDMLVLINIVINMEEMVEIFTDVVLKMVTNVILIINNYDVGNGYKYYNNNYAI